MPAGRPRVMTEQVQVQIIELIATTTKGLKTICEENDYLPDHSTVRQFIVDNKEFSDKYVRAKEDQAEIMADEIVEIADEMGLLTAQELTHEKIAAAKLRVDARKWAASKLKPKRYGNQVDMTTNGESLNKGFLGLLASTDDKDED